MPREKNPDAPDDGQGAAGSFSKMEAGRVGWRAGRGSGEVCSLPTVDNEGPACGFQWSVREQAFAEGLRAELHLVGSRTTFESGPEGISKPQMRSEVDFKEMCSFRPLKGWTGVGGPQIPPASAAVLHYWGPKVWP